MAHAGMLPPLTPPTKAALALNARGSESWRGHRTLEWGSLTLACRVLRQRA